MRVYFGVCGIGLGHIGRSATIAKKLRSMGNEVLCSTYLDAIDYAKQEGLPLVEAPPMRYAIKPDGSVDLRKTSAYPGALSLAIFLNQTLAEMRYMKAFGPDVVVSDSRVSSIVAAKTLRIPEVTLLNQYKVTIPRTEHFLRLARIGDAYILGIVGGLWAAGEKVLIPDFPLPFTISADNLGLPPIMEKKVTFIGPVMDVRPEDLPNKETVRKNLGLDDRPLIFAPISGSAKEKTYFLGSLRRALKRFPDKYQIVMSLGDPSSSTELVREGNVTVHSWLPNRFEFLKASDLVIARPGHGTITQSICYGKPLILVPTPNHTEQRNNARGAEKLGIAQIVHQEKLSYGSLLTCAEEALTSDHFVENAEHLRDKVSEYDGIEAATKIITFVAENQSK